METNQKHVQEQPAQLPLPGTRQQNNSAAGPQARTTPLLYNPDETARIVEHLTHKMFHPEYILLFGKLAGGTPFSDATAYDILIVVRETPDYDWMQIRRYLRYQMPVRRREIKYINLYVLPLSYVENNNTPFLYFTHNEGHLLYCKDHHYFRPKKPCNFAAAYSKARLHYDTFSELGMSYLERANNEYAEGLKLRPAALLTAQASVYFYHTLYYVYHGMEFDIRDPVVMHERMRTLSSELMLKLDDSHIGNMMTLPCLKDFLERASYDLQFDVAPKELEVHMERVEKAARIICQICEFRLELYKELSGK